MSNVEEEICSMEIDQFVTEFCEENHTSAGDDSLFYFETDFLPLKGNLDYLKLMKTLAILQAQRMKLCKDIEELRELQLKAIDNPYIVKDQILEGKLPCISRCTIEKVPGIDFSKYRSLGGNKKNFPSKRKATRQQISTREEGDKSSTSEIKVRGRLYNEKKPQTFNQLWTNEEQLRLEQLLIDIPPEPVEFRRWEKIAFALGSRTPQQVCSRVQKYFKKLEKAGIGPSTYRKNSYKKHAHFVHKQNKHFLYKPSTFFPGSEMGELEDTDSEEDSSSDSAVSDLSHWGEIHKKINEEKDNEELKVQHLGFKCKKCNTDPIIGVRWECKSCPSVSFCSDCMLGLCDMDPPPHPITHHFRPVDLFNSISYRTDAFSCDNYLDPNAHLTCD